MNSTPPIIKPPPPPSAGNPRGATPGARPAHSETSPVADLLGADLSLIGIVPFGLPSAVLLAGWVLLTLCLIEPFVLLLTTVLATVIFVAIAVAILALPYLLVRGLHRYRSGRPIRHPLVHRVRERHPAGHGSLTDRRGERLIHPPAAELRVAAQLYTAARVRAAVQANTSSVHVGVNTSQTLRSQ